MDKSRILTLKAKTYTVDAIGQRIESYTNRDVFCNIKSVTRAEWMAAGERGLKPQYVATMFEPDYQGEELCELDGVKYEIYRTYINRNENIELYLEKQVGATNG